MRIFLCGDYEFLCRLFGLSGALGLLRTACTNIHALNYSPLGRHCCLWCLIKSSDLIRPPAARAPCPMRSTASIISDYKGFEKAGSDIKKAKFHNNAIQEPFFKSYSLITSRFNICDTFRTLFQHILVGVPSRSSHNIGHILTLVCAS